MKRENVVLGMKVVPHSKSVGSHFDWCCWNKVKENKDPYLYVIRIDTNAIVLSNKKDDELGDHFLPEDFEPYIEENTNQENNNESRNVIMKKSELNSSMLFKMRDGKLCVLLPDYDNDLVFYNKVEIEEGYCDDSLLLEDYDEDLTPEDDDYDIVAIKQFDSYVKVISNVLNDKEPEEWDWIEEVEKVESKTPVIHNITLNFTLDSDNFDPANFLKQLNDALEKIKKEVK